jgi:hypothetical protein
MAQAPASYPSTTLRVVPLPKLGLGRILAVAKPSYACHISDSMTGDSPVLDRPALRATLLDMRIEPPDPGTRFETALARLQGWNPGFADRVTDEYRRFLYLAATAGFEVTPSQFVDEAWHLHLNLPHYRDTLCGRILGRPLEHRPGTGTPDDEQRCARQYEETLALYERVFDEPAPHDIWPRPVPLEVEEEEDEDSRWWQGRESRLAAALVTFAIGVAALAIGLQGLGTAFVAVALLLGAGILVETGFGRGRCRRGGGGDYWDGDAGSSCGSSCGGGCGGD